MNIIKHIIDDYEKLVKTDIKIPLSNGDIIHFTFHPQDLPHLLGLQHLVDNPILFEYSEKRLSATDLYNRMRSNREDAIDTEEFEKSIYFKEIYDGRIRYFKSEIILDIIESKQIVEFDASKIKNFSTKLEKVEYMFWKKYEYGENQYGYFGIGFMTSETTKGMNYPNTFFFRLDDDYICSQKKVLPYSMMMCDKNGKKTFKIYWEQVWRGLKKNRHYKKLLGRFALEDGCLDMEAILQCQEPEVLKEYELLQLDALDKIYLPYMKKDFRWTNDEKRFILERVEAGCGEDLYPGDVRQLLNEYRQRK